MDGNGIFRHNTWLQTQCSMASSLCVSSPTEAADAVATLSRTISWVFMPERTTVTSGWSQSQRKAHWAGVWRTG